MSSSVAMPVAPDALKRAVYARRDHFLAHVATLTMKQARRLIETDLGLDAKALDEEATKAAVAKYVDRVLASGDGPPENVAAASKENRAPAATKSPAPAKPRTEHADEDADEEEETDADEEEETDADEEGSDSDASELPSTKKRRVIEPKTNKTKTTKNKRKPAQKQKTTAAPVAGVVATLRDVCKRAGLTYQHVFMRHKDDETRIESLRGILNENGLDGKSSDAQIAKVRAKVELARDLDGIDQSNVIEGGRRRRAVATNDPWGQAASYDDERGVHDDDTDEDDEESDDDDDDDDDDDVSDADKKSSDSEVEPADLFFFDDDGDEAPESKPGPAFESKPAPADSVAPKAPRRGGALYSDSDEE
jgi:ribosomal protein L12E/L44/L45/RPP1/RPP2